MRVRVGLCLGLFLLSLAASATAQQPGAAASIRGRVIDPQRRGVPATIGSCSSGTG